MQTLFHVGSEKHIYCNICMYNYDDQPRQYITQDDYDLGKVTI